MNTTENILCLDLKKSGHFLCLKYFRINTSDDYPRRHFYNNKEIQMNYEIKQMLEKAETNYSQLTNRVDSLNPEALGKAINKFETVTDEIEELKNEVANLSVSPKATQKEATKQDKPQKELHVKEMLLSGAKSYSDFVNTKGLALNGNASLYEAELDTRILEQAIVNSTILSGISAQSCENLDYRRTVLTQRPAVQLTKENVSFTDVVETQATDYSDIKATFTKMFAYPWFTHESMELSDVDVEGNLQKLIGEQFSITLQDQVLHGSGEVDGDGNQHLKGITNACIDRSNAYVEALKPAATRARDILAAVSTGVADGIGATAQEIKANLIKQMLTVPERSQANGKWYVHPNTLSFLMQELVDTQGRSLIDIQRFEQSYGVWVNRPTLFGFQIVLNETIDEIGAGAAPIIFGDLKEAYTMLTPADSSHSVIDWYTLPDVTKFYYDRYAGSIVMDHEAVAVLVCKA